MVLDEISGLLSKRRAELVDMLENRNEGLQLERQHQIYGAINEIDLFLQTIDYYAKNSQEKDIGPISLARPVEQKNIFSTIFEGIKSKVSRNK